MTEYKRKCPECGKDLIYRGHSAFYTSRKKNTSCRKCSQSKVEGRSERFKGKNGPFYGRHHTAESIAKMLKNKNYSYAQTKEFAEKSARHGKDNGMYGRSFYDVWLEKYGKEEADKRMDIYKSKKSKRYSGKGNPMYGKPSPQGSGNGWSGWYKEHFFRSLRELSYMHDLDDKGLKWETGETKKYSIRNIFWLYCVYF